MNTHAEKTQENKSQLVAPANSLKQISGEPTFHFVDNRPEAIAQRRLKDMADYRSKAIQNKYLHKIVDKNPQLKRMTAELAKPNARAPMQMKEETIVQLMSSSRARERIAQQRNNRRKLMTVLLVVAANIIAGDYALEDVDDLLENPEDVQFLNDQISKQQQKAALRAQSQQAKFNNKAQHGRQNNNRRRGGRFNGR